MPVQLKSLDGPFGAEVCGFDPANITAEEKEALNRAFLEHHVLVYHGSGMSDDDLVAFSSCFGPIEMAREKSPLADRGEIMVVSNIRENGKELGRHPDGELIWHFDKVHQPIPNKAGVLHAIEIPDAGGETLFADMCQAYETLPAETQGKLEKLSALNSFTYGANRAEEKTASGGPRAVHPAVRRVPETGRKAIFVCRLMTDGFKELPESEGRALLDEVLTHAENPRFTYSHKWSVGDVVIWDNRCAIHSRNDFDSGQRRLMKRVTVTDHVAPAA